MHIGESQKIKNNKDLKFINILESVLLIDEIVLIKFIDLLYLESRL